LSFRIVFPKIDADFLADAMANEESAYVPEVTPGGG
jgi:hypothetical protein